MTRKFITALIPLVVCAGAMPAQAAPTGAYAVHGTLNAVCSSIGTSTPGSTYLRTASTNTTPYTVTTNPTTTSAAPDPGGTDRLYPWALKCTGLATLTVTPKAVVRNPLQNGAGTNSQAANYTAVVHGWGANFQATSNADKMGVDGGGAGSTASSDQTQFGTVNGTITVAHSSFTNPAGTSDSKNSYITPTGASYSGTIQLTITPK